MSLEPQKSVILSSPGPSGPTKQVMTSEPQKSVILSERSESKNPPKLRSTQQEQRSSNPRGTLRLTRRTRSLRVTGGGMSLEASDLSRRSRIAARISHQLSTAGDDAQHPAVLSHLRVLNVPQSTPPRPEIRKPSCAQRLNALVTKPGEICGLASIGPTGRPRR
jgi:hypothetical protein